MAQNITLLGASYTAVPAVTLPKTGGGTAKFSDASVTTAVASDVAEGKIFLLADGTQATGTGEGGGSITWELMVDQTCTITTYDGMRVIAINGYNEPLSANETYRITWGDNQYICNTIADPVGFTQDGYYMGNSSIFGSQYEDTGEPFVFYRTSSTRMIGATNDTTSSSVYVKIERQTTSSATLITKTITANGTYSAEDDDADGYSSVTVNVPTSGASSWTKVAENSYQVSTTSTYNVMLRTGNTDIWTSDKLLYIRIRDTAGPRSGYFYGSDNFVPNFKALSGSETATTAILKNCYKYSSGAYSTFSNSYGGRVTNVDSSGDITIPFRYSSSYSGTINGTYSIQVYLLDMPSGITIFE